MAPRFFAFPYFALVALFYRQSGGFIKTCDNRYEYWKTLPVLILSIQCLLSSIGLHEKHRVYTAIGLFFGAIGDYLIGRSHDCLIEGAFFFSLGHIFYLLTFAHRVDKVSQKLLAVTVVWYFLVGSFAIGPLIRHYRIASIFLITYSLILSLCFLLSGSLYLCGGRNERSMLHSNLLRTIGFLLFYASDSALALASTGYRFPYSEIVTLSTYFTAQYFILCSAYQLNE